MIEWKNKKENKNWGRGSFLPSKGSRIFKGGLSNVNFYEKLFEERRCIENEVGHDLKKITV